MTYDVLIAGAGPVGLFLACELRLAGLTVLILETSDAPHSAMKRLPFGLRGLNAPTIEAFYRRGMLDSIRMSEHSRDGSGKSVAGSAHWMQQQRRPAGHFAGIQFYQDRIDADRWPYRLPGPAGTSMAVTMEHLESVLTAHALAMGVEIRRGCGVEALEQADHGVTVQAGGHVFRGRWLVGCDGGRSTVRKAAGFGFAGTEPEFTGYSVEVELAGSDKLLPGRHYTPTGMYTFTPPGTIAMVDFDGGGFHRAEPITREHIEAVLRCVSGTEVSVVAVHVAATWTDRAFQATAYRRGKVLLAGDAAHIHSPLGGQGLNLGLGDAMNLGWKLAATVRGDAPDGLLDSYESERRPVGAQVLDWSRAQVAIMPPSPSSRALEAIIRDLIETRDGATYFAERVSGVSLRYDLGDVHPLVGRSAPDFALADGRRLGELMVDGKGVLLDLDVHGPLRALAGRWGDRMTYVASDATNRLGLNAVVVRPDGVVAWASEGASDLRCAARAATRWFGPPHDEAR
ncbi:FAD-dependent oxidoreductase [Stakelama flava]|uniref:FAD-dependent oxidoreductase n=1 Tax=Stakelama flava TaxID=2860338 RepID=UPI0031BB367E